MPATFGLLQSQYGQPDILEPPSDSAISSHNSTGCHWTPNRADWGVFVVVLVCSGPRWNLAQQQQPQHQLGGW
jgi:hypothetical protein